MLNAEEKLVVIWSSSDREVAKEMALLYSYNAKRYGWWDDIILIVWGPSEDLLSQDFELQEYIIKIREAGIKLEACKKCSDDYGVSKKLEQLGIDVKYMGEPLTQYLKEGRKIITF